MNKDTMILTSLKKLGVVYFYKKFQNKIEIMSFTKLRYAILFSASNPEYKVCPYLLSKKLKDLGVCYEDTEVFN